MALVLDGPRGLRGWLGPSLIAFTGLSQIDERWGRLDFFALIAAGLWILALTVGLLVVRGNPDGLSALVPATRRARRTGK